ncbi:MBL fold metallo-hydrolase [Candidatus Parcubacteria bacterium]|nr:MBL fold metallo-hydrolase [Candidatus Parcubacteria bacterium]
MQILCLPLGQLQTNCYLVSCPQTNEGIIIDPADSGDFIAQKVQELGIKPQLIVATHGHFDHVLGALELKMALQIPFALHPNDLPILNNVQKSARYWLKAKADPPPPVDRWLREGDILQFGQEKLTVIETPGHTPGGISLYDGESTLFSGDTLFRGAIGRSDYSYSNLTDLRDSLRKLLELPTSCRVYSGHGPSTTIGEEKKNLDNWLKNM